MNKITYDERAQVYAMALDKFGAGKQIAVAIEEMAEVQKELCKVLRGDGDMLHLAEEVADATIMLEQIRLMFCINDEVCAAMDAKIDRLRKRIEKS